MRRLPLLFALVVGLLPAAPARASGCVGTFCAGAARGDITPPVTTPMWGYTARQMFFSFAGDPEGFPSSSFGRHVTSADAEGYCKTFQCNRGIHTRLYANAFVLQDAHDTKLAIVQVDLGFLSAEVHQGVADRIQAATGIDRAHLMISATHTHGGPGGTNQYQGYALLGGDELDPRVFEAIVGGISRAVVRANEGLAPAALAWGQAELGANHNRRTQQWCLNPEAHCVDGYWDGTGPTPHNGTLTVVRVDGQDGRRLGAITNYANHGTVGGDDNLLFSGDNQAFAVREVERAIGDGAIDVLLNGSQGDQSPNGDAGRAWDGLGGIRKDYAEMEGAGRNQATGTMPLYDSLASKLSDDVILGSRFEHLCFCGQAVEHPGPNYDGDPLWDHVSPFAALGAGGVTQDDGTHNEFVTPTQGKKSYALLGVGTNPSITRLNAFRVNDLAIVSIPGEPTVQLGRRIIASVLDAGRGMFTGAIVAGLANDYDSYMTTQEEYRSYRYEASFMLFGPQMGQLLLEEQTKLAAALASGEPVDECPPGLSCPAPHPDTSATALPVVPTLPDLEAGAAVSQPSGARRFQTVAFSWTGGSPSAEWAPDEDRVQLVKVATGDGPDVLYARDSIDTQTILSYEKIDGRHVWTAEWDILRDAPTGTYRFEINGHRTLAPGMAEPYSIGSGTFAIVTGSVSSTIDGNVVRLAYPRPDPQTNFHYRRPAPESGTVTALVGGQCVSADVDADGTATFPADVQYVVSVSDAYGNGNTGTCPGEPVSILITSRGFEPYLLRVSRGARVSFYNADLVSRSVVAVEGEFDSGPIEPGAIWTYTADTPGTFDFYDGTRPYVIGALEVLDG
jgi:neutral ceramidase